MTDTPEKRKLGELRVVDLKLELEKRGKDGNGVKNVLLERLTQTLRDAGEDPEAMEFEILVGKTSLKKGKANSGGKPDEETNVVDATVDRNTDATDVAIKLEETVDSLDGEVTAETNKDLEKDIQNEQDTDTVQPCPALAEENDKETVVDKQPNKQQTSETINTPKLIADGNSNKPVDIKEESKEADNEDSLNLTIGEEDEKLLHDSNMDVEQKEQASRKPKEQPVDNSKENPSEETKKNDDKREGKLEKNIIPSSSEKDAAAARTTASSVMSTRAGGEKGTSVSPTSTATVTAAVAVDSDEKTKEGVDSGNSTAANVGRNLWVSRLSSLTRATDLKQIFSKYGKVIGAKVVTNSRTPGTRCYGYVTMASTKDATECISHLHRTELHGRLISVERAKSELGPARQSTVGTDSSTPKTPISNNKGAAGIKGDLKSKALSSEDKKKNGDVSAFAVATVDKERSASQKDRKPRPNRPIMEGKRQQPPSTDSRPRPGTEGEKPYHQPRVSNIRKSTEAVGGYRRSRGRSRSSRERRSTTQGSSTQHRERDRTRQRSRDSGRGGTSDYSRDSKEVLSLQKIREERERHRVRERERQLREEERRRREVRARQREEEERLQREREKLAAERERIEKEKAELLRIVRERQKLEREKIELEHLELKQQQRKIEEAKRSLKRPSSDRYEDDRKRSAPDRRVEAPPPPRFDSSISSSTGRSNYDRISSSEKKSRLDDYSSTSKRDDFRRDSFKRGSDDYRRGGDDYKRGGDDYKRDSRDDYKSSGRSGDDYGKRDSGYSKRDIDRPMSSSYDSRGAGGSGGSGLLSQSMSKDNRYNDRSNDYRGGAGGGSGAGLNGSSGGGSRGGADDRDRNNSSGNRYGNDRASGGGGLTSGGNWHNNSGMPQLGGMSSLGNWGDKSNDSASGGGGWRNMDNGQDRYDRTYNERKPMQMSSGAGGGFMDQPRTNQFMGGNGGGRPQDRYSQSMSNRFDNGRY